MKVGLIRLSSLGDVVLATSVLKGLREAQPASEIVFIVRSRYVDVFRNNSYLNRVIEWKSGEPFRSLISDVRDEGFDCLVDLHATTRSRSLTAVSGAKRVLRYKKGHMLRRLSILRKNRPPMKHVVDRYIEAVRPLGVKETSPVPAMYPGTDDLVWAAEFLGSHGYSTGPLVGMAPGARRATKRWPAGRYAELAARMQSSQNARVVVVGDKGDVEAASEILKTDSSLMNAVCETDLGKLAALLSRCDLLVSNDSGPVHVAVAVGTPVLAIFGPTIEEFGFTPYGRRNRIISRELYCRPCSLHGTEKCPEGHFRCMEEIDPGEVHRLAGEILEP